ncbi:MAG: class B sortase [Ruminococcus sp.]|nr:class B sortase [Ruminococcus sp.]
MKRQLIYTAAILSAVVGALAGYRYFTGTYLPEKRLSDAAEEQQKLIDAVRPETVNINESNDEHTTDPLAPVREVNDDTVGWIYIPGTNIDLPIVQGEDNELYLHNGFNGQYNYELGCPFLDNRCSKDMSGFNSIVYAHNIEGRKMFADIALFRESGFISEHSKGTLTLPDGSHEVDFFAYLPVQSDSAAYHTFFIDSREQNEYISYLFSASSYTQTYSEKDLLEMENIHILLLSTCTFENKNARGILAGIIN